MWSSFLHFSFLNTLQYIKHIGTTASPYWNNGSEETSLHLIFVHTYPCCSESHSGWTRFAYLFESRGILTYPRFGPTGELRISAFSPLCSGLPRLGLCFFARHNEIGWVQQLLLFAPVVPSSGPEGDGREVGKDWRKANMQRQYFSHVYGANQLGDERGERRRKEK